MTTNTLFLGLVLSAITSSLATEQPAPTYSWTNLPRIAQPAFRKATVNVLAFGAKPDGITLNTSAINKAILTCSQKGDGVVLVPAGLWMTGPIELKSNVNLHLKKSATLLFTPDKSQYALVEGVYEGKSAARNQSPMSGLVLKTEKSVELTDAQGITLTNVQLITQQTNPVIALDNSSNLTFNAIQYNFGTSQLFTVKGERSHAKRVTNTDLSGAQTKAEFSQGATGKQLVFSPKK